MADYADIVERVRNATKAFDKRTAASACEDLIARMQGEEQPPAPGPIKTILGALRNKRYFDLMEAVGDAAIQAGQNHPQVRRQYAQGLIDHGSITAAINVLTVLAMDTGEAGTMRDPAEHAEARGLLGRAYKQQYVTAVNRASEPAPGSVAGAAATADRQARARANRKHLDRAARAYFEVYESDPQRHLWHGINTVACLCRAERDAIALEGYPKPREIATQLLQTIDEVTPRSRVEIWDRATAVEACVALDRIADALDWLADYAPDPAADAFELGSTLRQLTEVWELTSGSPPGSALLPILRGELLKREGGGFQLSGRPEAGASTVKQEAIALEAVLGDTRFVPLQWYRMGLQRCDAIARIETKWGQGFGSGFLIRGDDLHPTLAGEMLLLTNAHVISTDPLVQKGMPPACPPDRARVRFEARDGAADGAKTYGIAQLLWTSPPGKLDASLLKLESKLSCEPPYPIAVKPPVANTDRVYVIGHPMGGTLSLSIQDNRVIDVLSPKLHYRAPTQPGSSGSAVFNQDWELVGLHHAGSKQMRALSSDEVVEANEGIWISAIIAAFQAEFTP